MLAQDIVSVNGVTRDTLVRSDTSLEKLAALNPVFDRSSSGSITAGNASALTDGAAALFLASEEFVTTRRLPVLAWIDGIQFSALDPAHGLLMAPVFALPQLLSRSAIRLESIDRFEIHEAFSAQVLANLQVWETGWKRYPDYKPLGPISRDRINLLGGSIALGHPFAATGGRLMLSLARQLDGSSVKRGVISVCAAGGMACALSLSVPAD
jgi:acetyl-CoA acetyltransferase family protein